jgi:hypothetical protein
MSAYEIHGIREDGTIFGEVGFERQGATQPEADAAAYVVAEEYAAKWAQAGCLRLYRTPEPNMTSVSSFNLWPDEMQLVTTVYPKREPCPVCGNRFAAGHRCNFATVAEDEVPFS